MKNNVKVYRGDGRYVDVRTHTTAAGDVVVKLQDHGTSSCVNSVWVNVTKGRCYIDWRGTFYAYDLQNPDGVLRQFMLTQSLGRVANWVKGNDTEKEFVSDGRY